MATIESEFGESLKSECNPGPSGQAGRLSDRAARAFAWPPDCIDTAEGCRRAGETGDGKEPDWRFQIAGRSSAVMAAMI